MGSSTSPEEPRVTAYIVFIFTINPGFDLNLNLGIDLHSVLAWDPVSETWSEADKLDHPMNVHASTALPLDAIQDYCS